MRVVGIKGTYVLIGTLSMTESTRVVVWGQPTTIAICTDFEYFVFPICNYFRFLIFLHVNPPLIFRYCYSITVTVLCYITVTVLCYISILVFSM